MDMMRPVSVAMPPVKATGLAATVSPSGGNYVVRLSWNDNSIAETSYLVQRMTNGTWADVGKVRSPLNQPNTTGVRIFDDTTVLPNTAYQYRVVALNQVGYGGAFPSMTVQSTSDPVAASHASAARGSSASDQPGSSAGIRTPGQPDLDGQC